MLDFNQPLTGLDGAAVKDEKGQSLTVGKLLAGTLVSANKGDALKFFGWAQKMYNGEALELDKSDETTLKDFIKNSESITILAKAQALLVFKD